MKINWQPKTKIEKDGLKAVRILNLGETLTPDPSPKMGEGSSNLKKKHFQAFWVGGIVRNILLKRESDNLDIATDATPDSVEKVFKKAKIKTKPVGKKYGSILAIVGKFPIEVTTFRSEGRYSDKRHPDEIQFIKDYLNDAKRRDFTINALYFDPIKKELYDPTGGIKDLGLKILRFVGDPKKRIDEDALRMLRGVRLATQLGFSAGGGPASGWKLEKNSFAAIKTRAKYIQGISGERVKAELDKILLSKNRVAGLKLLDESGLLKFIIPEVESLKKFKHKSKIYHLEGDMWTHTLLAISKAKGDDLNFLYALLFHDIAKPKMAKEVLKDEGWVFSTRGHPLESTEIFKKAASRLKFSNRQRLSISWLIENHDIWRDFITMKPETQFEYVSNPNFSLLIEIMKADRAGNISDRTNDKVIKKTKKVIALGKKLLAEIETNKEKIEKLANGQMVIKYSKIPPGPRVGQLIKKIKTAIVEGKIKNENDLKNFLTRFVT